jgi:hypothetical protein
MQTLIHIPFELDEKSLVEKVRLEPDSDDAKELADLIGIARRSARPKAVYKECFIDRKGDGSVTINGTLFSSRTLRKNLDRAERVFAFVVTCGREMDQIPVSPGDYLKEFWRDAIKTTLLGIAHQHLSEHLRRRFRLGETSTMSPGAGDADTWPIQQQKELFALLGDVEGEIGVRLTDSFLMIPNKTISGLRFPTETDFRSCQVCHREVCPSRSAPFDKSLWESMQHD